MRPSRERLLRISTAALLLLASLPAGAQEKKDKKEPPPSFTVSLNVHVLDAQDRPVAGLKREDFQLTEDGVAHVVTSVEPLEGALAFGLVVDNSGSLRDEINKVVSFGHLIVEGSGEGSAAFVIRFIASEQIELKQEFTSNKRALGAALDDMFIEGGQTAINDALYLSAEHLAKFKSVVASPRRYSLVLFTDGEDRASHYKTRTVLEKLRGLGVPVFVIAFTAGEGYRRSPDSSRRYMERVAVETGGAVFLYEKRTDPSELGRRVLLAMAANYRVTYTPANQKRDKTPRSVQVNVSAGADGAPRKVSAQAGYIAPPK